MEIRGFLGVLRRYWPSTVLCIALGGILAFAFSVLRGPSFVTESIVQLSVPQDQAESVSQLIEASDYAAAQVMVLSERALSAEMLQPIIGQLGLNTVSSQLAQNIIIDQPTPTMMRISGISSDPEVSTAITLALSERVLAAIEMDSQNGSGLVATVISPVEAPIDRNAESRPTLLLVGLLAGVALGVAQATLRGVLDNKIRTADDVEEVTEHPVLATISVSTTITETTLAPPQSLPAEEFRRLRAALQYSSPLGLTQHRAVVVTSALPGEGKTTTAINLATSLSQAGTRVLLIDANLRTPDVAIGLGIQDDQGLTDILSGSVSIRDATRSLSMSGLHVITSGGMPDNPAELLASDGMRHVLRQTTVMYDVVVVDTPSLLTVADAVPLTASGSEVLVVVSSGQPTPEQLHATISTIESVGGQVVGTVLNRVKVGGPVATTSRRQPKRAHAHDIVVSQLSPKRPASRITSHPTVPRSRDRVDGA